MIALDRLDYHASEKNLSEVAGAPNYKFVQGDLRELRLLTYLIKTEKVDTILNLAHQNAYSGSPAEYVNDNLVGSHALAEAARLAGSQIKLLLHASSDEVYGPEKEDEAGEVEAAGGVNEDRTLNPITPFAAAKAGAECVVKSFHRSYKVPIIITRASDTYGPRCTSTLPCASSESLEPC